VIRGAPSDIFRARPQNCSESTVSYRRLFRTMTDRPNGRSPSLPDPASVDPDAELRAAPLS
jgi:hypothetical protein